MPCLGPGGSVTDDISAFRGHLRSFPDPSFGSYAVLDIDQDLCFERETRLGQYRQVDAFDANSQLTKWDSVDWGALQSDCFRRNEARFDPQAPAHQSAKAGNGHGDDTARMFAWNAGSVHHKRPRSRHSHLDERIAPTGDTPEAEPRAAVLLRSYTSKEYTEDDRQSIRALVSELGLRSGGEYQVFLFVHVKERGLDLSDSATRSRILHSSVPVEFQNMTVLWDDDSVQAAYPKLDKDEEATVHNAQWLSVQQFTQEHREFDYVWN